MFRKSVSTITLAAFVLYTMALTGCTKVVTVPMDESKIHNIERGGDPVRGPIKSLRKRDGTIVKFNARHGRVDKHTNAVVGYTPSNEYVSVPLNEVASLYVSRADALKSTLVVAGALTLLGVVIGAVMWEQNWPPE